ncbi:MAG: glycosyltransferase, partial [Chromatiales bacterium]|nr:glycosyltransferase [Chromatiales bacterium]
MLKHTSWRLACRDIKDDKRMLNFLDLVHFSIVALLGSTILLIALGHRVRTTHALTSLLYLAAILALSQAFLSYALNAPPEPSSLVCALLIGIAVILLARNWNAVGQICFAMALLCVISYLAYVINVTVISAPGPLLITLAASALALIAASLVLMIVHTFEIIDVLCRVTWRRCFTPQPSSGYTPKISLHVPAYNEPPELVMRTLDALAALDYSHYEVIVVDDNTSDPHMWNPVREHCQTLGFRFVHLHNWPGYKSGALNFALSLAAPDAEIIGVIDADYIVEKNYLSDLVGFFRNPKIAFVQTPQDYREITGNRYALALYRSYQYFFKLSMASRNERNGIIFTGTMGLIRKSALAQVSGWDEWCITEDAEVALKLLNLGYESVYIDQSYGRGLMPLTFEDLRSQRFRWAFGGMQVLRLHWKKLLPGSRLWDRDGKLTFGQKFDFWSGALQWLNDPLTFLFTAVLLACAVSFTLGQPVLLQPVATSIIFMPFLFIAFGMLKMLWALRQRLHCSLTEAYHAFLVLMSLTWVVTMACTLGLLRKHGRFLRTPKYIEGRVGNTLRVIRSECLVMTVVLAIVAWVSWYAPTGPVKHVLCGLLLWQVYIYSAAFVVNRWSMQSASDTASEERGQLQPTISRILPVGTALIAQAESQAPHASSNIEEQTSAVAMHVFAAHA